MKNIYLLGPMGAGKSTIGKYLASELDWEFYDSDRVIEDRAGAPLSWIFDMEGEEGFKRREEKVLEELSLAQIAMLAGLPQAPSRINPIANPKAALKRRKHVLGRMLDENVITKKQYQEALDSPITAKYYPKQIELSAPHAAELIRNVLYTHLGDIIYTSGYKVYSSIDSEKQTHANRALIQGVEEYDLRHGYRGPLDNSIDIESVNWEKYPVTDKLQLGYVADIHEDSVSIITKDHQLQTIPFSNMSWARKALKNGYLGNHPQKPSDILHIGDLIHVADTKNGWKLAQIPEVEAGLVAIDPKTDEILALVGGYNFNLNRYNHVTQAKRQPGSSFKPFIYAAALEKGYTLTTKVNDAPIIKKDQSQDNLIWRPQNHNHKFTGMTSLRDGLFRSKNLVTIRILESIGIRYALDQISKFGFDTKEFPASLSIALGTPNLTLIDLAAGYAAFANEGIPAKPYLISKIVNPKGDIIFTKDNLSLSEKKPAISKQVAFLITSVLKEIVQKGRTSVMAKQLINRVDIAGKTGTTNNHKDTWYAGFNKDVVAISWLGFDVPKSVHEYGWKSAFPIWLYFMAGALKNTPEQEQVEPSNIVKVRIDPQTGLLANSDQENSYFELFREEYAPTKYAKSNHTSSEETVNYLF